MARTSLTPKSVCNASVRVIASSLRLCVTSSISSASPTVMRHSSAEACGHHTRLEATGTNRNTSCVASPVETNNTTTQDNKHTKPRTGNEGALACGPNHGQHTGTPPRTDLPALYLACGDIHTTGGSSCLA